MKKYVRFVSLLLRNSFFLITVGSVASSPAHAVLPEPIAKALRAKGILTAGISTAGISTAGISTAGKSGTSISIIAQSLSGEAPIIAHQIELPLNPASVMKLVTTWSALNILGPDYRWQTSAFLQGKLVGDILNGDLVLKGGGDPKLVIEDLTEWLGAMRRSGLRDIKGDLIIDESFFENIGPSMESFDADTGQPYNVRPHPMMLNFKSTKFTVAAQGTVASVLLDPPLSGVQIDNQIKIVSGPCRHGANGLTVSDVGPISVRLSGLYSASCGEQSTYAAVLDHRAFIFALFKSTWQSLGGTISGTYKSGLSPSGEWSVWRSPRTLADITKDINKFSNNVMTRHLLLQMGVETSKANLKTSASIERGRTNVQRLLKSQGLDLPELILENGSGLSRLERVSARSLAKLLIAAADSPLADVYRNSLPIVGVDGTMSRRLPNSGVVGNAWIKTGSINQVSAIAGYVQSKSGRRYAIAMLANGAGANAMHSVQDQLLLWVYENG